MSRALLIFFTLVIGFILGWSLHSYLSYRKAKNEVLILKNLNNRSKEILNDRIEHASP